MITKLFADRLSEYGIPVNEVRPGIIATDMTSGVKEKYDTLIENGLLPIKRWGTPEDVAKDGEDSLQKLHDKYIKRAEEIFATKEKEIMTV